MAITAQMVKSLREKTGVGMMDCKKALAECGGDEEKAVSYLREKGLAKAAKKLAALLAKASLALTPTATANSLLWLNSSVKLTS